MKIRSRRAHSYIGLLSLLIGLLLVPVMVIAAPSAPEKAASSNAFVDTIGIVTHFNYERTYRDNSALVVQLLGDSGIRHIRDGMGDAKSRQILAQLAARGVKLNLVVDYRTPLSQIVSYPSLLPAGMVDAYEGPNELDLVLGGDAYLGILHSFMPAFYHAVKSDPRTSSIAIIGPSLTTARHYAATGDLSVDLDYGNMHNYVFGRNPGTTGWDGPIHYGSTPFMMNAARNISGTKPIMTTELGYGTSSKSGELNEATQLKYLMRAFFEQALNGVLRTYSYAFLDDGAAQYNTYGILRHDLSPKPSYNGLKNMIKLLSDSGPARTDTVQCLIAGPPTVHHYLMEKSDGSLYLAIWNETPSLVLKPGGDERDLNVAPINATVTLDHAIGQPKIHTFDRNGTMHTAALGGESNILSIPVTDSVSILEWH